jgi:hypothetical protein
MPETGDPRHPSFLKPRKIRVANPPLFPPPPFREFMLFNRKRRPTFSAAKPSLWKNPASAHKGNRCRYQRRWRDGSRFDRGCAAQRLIHVAAYIEQVPRTETRLACSNNSSCHDISQQKKKPRRGAEFPSQDLEFSLRDPSRFLNHFFPGKGRDSLAKGAVPFPSRR